MATDTAVPQLRRPFRPFFPLSVLLVAALSIVGLQNLPADWRAFWPTIATWIVIMLSGLLIAGWWFLYSGLSWAVRLAIPLSLLGALVGTVQVERVHFYTDMVPDYYFRWQTPPRPPQQDVLGPVALPESKPTDAPAYRGRNRDGSVVGPALARDWKTQPPREIWREGVGTGLGGIAVVGNLAITLEQRDNEEAVAAYNTENGKLQWIRRYPAHFNEQMGGPGPRTTPTVVGDRVITLGAQGDLLCLKITDGSILWGPIPILKNRDKDNLPWALAGSPLVYTLADGRTVVVVNPGNQNDQSPGRALIAFNLKDGTEVWANGNAWASYSTPQLNKLGGKQQIVLLDGDGLIGADPETGQEWWRYPWKTHQHINISQPIVVGDDRVFVSSGYNMGCAQVKVTEANGAWKVEELWKNENKPLRLKMSSGVLRDGFIYGLDEGFLACIEAATGELRWSGDRPGQYGHGQILLADDLIVVLGEHGQLALVEATPTKFTPRGLLRGALPGKTWNVPSLVDGRLYIRNDKEMACYDLTGPPAK